jgi:UDP-glucose:(heptosyl)LPS alpha-1,3-glucosyltransferase
MTSIIILSGWMSTLAFATNQAVRIAITIEKLDVRRGGAEVNTVRLIRQLVARGHEVHLFTESVNAELPAGVVIHPVPVRSRLVARRQWKFTHGVERALRAHSFDATVACQRGYVEDIVWAQDISYPATVEGSARSYYYSPWRQMLRRLQPRFSLKAWMYGDIERRQFSRRPPPYLITVSQMAAKSFQDDYHLPPDRIRFLHNQIDADRFSPEKLQPLRDAARKELGVTDELVVLFVGQNFRRKGVRPLVEAAGLLARQRRNFRVVIAGLGPKQAAPYRRIAVEQTIFLGETRQVEQRYAAADVFCLPSFYDAFGMVALEAMAAGLPVIVSKYCGIAELIRPGIDGVIFDDPTKPEQIVECLLPLFDRKRREQIGQAAMQTARKTCAPDASKEIGAVIEKLVAQKSQQTSAAS